MNKKYLLFALVALLLIAALSACGGGGAEVTSDVGDVGAGKTLFAQPLIGAQPGCSTCHSLNADEVIVGPSLAGIGTRAETRVSGTSAEDYIRTSILHPDDYIVDGFQPGVMVQVWEQELTPEEVDNVVAYLLTLK